MPSIAGADAERLEFLRAGIGLLIDGPDGAIHTAYVSRGADDRTALWDCTCRLGRRGKPCDHRRALEGQLDACHALWGGRSWQARFEPTVWHGLARSCFQARPVDIAETRAVPVSIGATEAFRLESTEDRALLAVVPRDAAGARLLDRCGLGPSGRAEGSRARLLDRLQRMQCTELEQALNQRGSRTDRQAFEESLIFRLAYHAFHEWGDEPGVFRPFVDVETGDFVLSRRSIEDDERLRLVIPAPAVEVVLGLLREAQPDRLDLVIHPIPLRSLFKVTASTELDADVRPLIELLQRDGESRFFDRDDVERFRYGRLVYVKELQVLAELELPGRERKFAAPRRMTLARSQVPAFVQQMEKRAGVVVDASLRKLAVFREPGAAEARPARREGDAYWTELSFLFGGSPVPLGELLRAKERRLSFLEIASGWIDLHSPALDPLWALGARREPRHVRGTLVRLGSHELLRLAGSTSGGITVDGGAPAAAPLEHLLALEPRGRHGTPERLLGELRGYQKLGLDWLLFLYENGLSGLLCDDMGLGKTHQVMAFLLSLVEHENVRGPFLVVAPTSVVSHWRDKLRRFAPSLGLTLYHGPERALPDPASPDGGGQVVLTSYGLLRNDLDRLSARSFAVAVFDEVQHLKNRDTQLYRAARDLAATMKLGLSGTPLENHLGDLKALVDLVLPGHLGSDQEFVAQHGPAAGPAGTQRLRRRLAPFLLRRLKHDVLHELPEKIEDVRRCPLSDEQRDLYRGALESRGSLLRTQLLLRDQPIPYLHVFALLNHLKRVCDHPALARNRPAEYASSSSGKWDLFVEILSEALDSGQKVVVFSQYLGMLEIVERHLTASGIGFATLTGATRDRGEVVRRFNEDAGCRVFVGSLKAGGTGIDLVGGSLVIHYDRWWNAAREDQATDRVHRIGQRRAVQVFKLVSEGTLEERIAEMIESKRQLMSDAVAVDDPHLAKVFTREELLELLRPI